MLEVVAALIRDGDGRFLVCKRPEHKARAGLWEFVGGKVEAGETPRQALARECFEELAITVRPGEVFMEVVHEYPDVTVHLTVFETDILAGVPQRLEHADLRWITVEDIPDLTFCPADEVILEKIRSNRQTHTETPAAGKDGPLVALDISPALAESETAVRLREKFGNGAAAAEDVPVLRLDEHGLSLAVGDQVLRGDFTRMLPRIRGGRMSLSGELLVRAARIKGVDAPVVIDATAGLGEDSLLLAAAGAHVILFERNPVIFELLRDAWMRAAEIPELRDIVARMEIRHEDSVTAMAALDVSPDVILLDPMFPARQKSALVKKKLQVIQKLESPCDDERQLLLTAMRAGPKKLIVKRPPKGPYLANIRPDHAIEGKAVRFDCFVSPIDRIHKFESTY